MVVRIPPGLFFQLLGIAQKHRISVEQLVLELTRSAFSERYGWKCLHDAKDRKFSRNKKQWYCSACWTFFDIKAKPRGAGFDQVERKPIWELAKELTAEEWSKQIKPDNQDLK